jgi:erythromycin esterase-like protein
LDFLQNDLQLNQTQAHEQLMYTSQERNNLQNEIQDWDGHTQLKHMYEQLEKLRKVSNTDIIAVLADKRAIVDQLKEISNLESELLGMYVDLEDIERQRQRVFNKYTILEFCLTKNTIKM